jgi:hypothetical protein
MDTPREYQRQWGFGQKNPLSGGLGQDGTYQIAGLGGQARQIGRTSGPGYQNEAAITSSPSGRAGSRSISSGSLSTSGPAPTGGPPPDPKRIGPSGPSKLAAGVKGNFDRPAPHIMDIPQWGKVTGEALKSMGGAIGNIGTVTALGVDSLKSVGMKAADVGLFATPMGGATKIGTKLIGTRIGSRVGAGIGSRILRPPAQAQTQARPTIPTQPGGVSPGGIIIPRAGYTQKSTGNP